MLRRDNVFNHPKSKSHLDSPLDSLESLLATSRRTHPGVADDHRDHRLHVSPAAIGVGVRDVLQDQPVDSGDEQAGKPARLDGNLLARPFGRLVNPPGDGVGIPLVPATGARNTRTALSRWSTDSSIDLAVRAAAISRAALWCGLLAPQPVMPRKTNIPRSI